MSEIHIISQSMGRESVKVAFHFDVPEGDNFNDISYQEIAKLKENHKSIVENHSVDFPEEAQKMKDGKIMERAMWIYYPHNIVGSEAEELRTLFLQKQYTAEQERHQDNFVTTWELYGHMDAT